MLQGGLLLLQGVRIELQTAELRRDPGDQGHDPECDHAPHRDTGDRSDPRREQPALKGAEFVRRADKDPIRSGDAATQGVGGEQPDHRSPDHHVDPVKDAAKEKQGHRKPEISRESEKKDADSEADDRSE